MIIVTGGAGFIGSAIVWKLNQLGHTDILIVDEKAKGAPKWKNIEKRKFADYLESDVFLKQIQDKSLNPTNIQALFHMGACSDTTETNEAYLNQTNYEYTKHLAEWSLKNSIRFIYASSAATYGGGECGYLDEDSIIPRLKPLNLYGLSKQKFDLWVLQHKLQDKIAGFKFFNVFGPNEYHKGHMRSMVDKGHGQIKQAGKIGLFKSYKKEYADGEQLRDFIYVKDVLKILFWFWENPSKNGIFNLGTGRTTSWNRLAEAIFSSLQIKPKIHYIEMPENLKTQYQYYTKADLNKLRAVGFQEPFERFEDSVNDYVVNYLEKPDPYL